MRKIIFIICITLLATSSACAKEGKLKYGKVIYKGNVESNMPQGMGSLYYKGKDSAFLEGTFKGYSVEDATFHIGQFIYKGSVSFKPNSDSKSDTNMSFTLLKGEIQGLGFVHDVSFESIGDVNSLDYTLYGKKIHEVLQMNTTEATCNFYTALFDRNGRHTLDVDSIVFVNKGLHRTPIDKSKNLWMDKYDEDNYQVGTLKDKELEVSSYGIVLKDFSCKIRANYHAKIFQYNGKSYNCDEGVVSYTNGKKYEGTFLTSKDGIVYINGTLSANGKNYKYVDGENITLALEEEIAKKQEADRRAAFVKDSIDIAEGRKVPPYSYYLKDCICKDISTDFISSNGDHVHPLDFAKTSYYRRLELLCTNNIPYIAGKGGLSDLDLYKWEKSAEYNDDLQKCKKERNQKYGLIIPVYQFGTISVRRDGFKIELSQTNYYANLSSNLLKENIQIGNKLLFPIKPSVIKGNHTDNIELDFPCNNISQLEKIQAVAPRKASILLIFSPSLDPVGNYAYYVQPIGMYLIYTSTGQTLADLTPFIRKFSPSVDNPKITKAKAQVEQNNQKAAQNKKKSQHYCSMCGGKGYKTGVNMGGVKGKTTEKCITCGGTGYVYY